MREGNLSEGYHPEMEQVHRENAAKLRDIVNSVGWPTISGVGVKANEAAWLIVQHSIGEPSFMKRCYQLMNESVHDINPQHKAYLYDRICYFEGKPQRYGTQHDHDRLYPVENKSEVNALRKGLKLKPYPIESIVQAEPSDSHGDLHKDPAFNKWRKRVGWIGKK